MLKKHKNNNKGFSLIELLVAIAILAVVMIPMLHSFVTSARANAKARKVMEATSVAQNLFEELKSEDLDTYLASPDCTKTQVMDGVNPVKDIKGKDVYTYTRTFSNLEMNSRKFGAKVTLDPQGYTGVDPANPDSASQTNYNTDLYSNLSKLSKSSNGFYIQKSDQELNTAKEFDPGQFEDVLKEMTREIMVEVDHDNSTKLTTAHVTVTYKNASGATLVPINHVEIYNNSASLTSTNPSVLSNIFVCFYPMYNMTGTTPTEKIIVKNPTNYKFNLFLVKQTTRDTDPSYSAVQIQNYKVALEMVDDRTSFDEDGDGSADVVTSVATNLWKTATDPADPDISLLDVSFKKSNGNPAVIGTFSAAQLLNMSNLSKSDSQCRIYNVKIEVYEGDSSAKVLTKMEGTKIQ